MEQSTAVLEREARAKSELDLRSRIRLFVQEADYNAGSNANDLVKAAVVAEAESQYFNILIAARTAKEEDRHFTPEGDRNQVLEQATIAEHLRGNGLLENTYGRFGYRTTKEADLLLHQDRFRGFHS